MAVEWSDDCLACLCGLPHTLQAHIHAVAQAQEEWQTALRELDRVNADVLENDVVWSAPFDDL